MTIVASVDFVLVFFFFPETQYRRPLAAATGDSTNESSTDKTSTVDVGEQQIQPKKSRLQDLNPWSSINPGSRDNPSFFFLLIRPWPLAIYPAVVYSFFV